MELDNIVHDKIVALCEQADEHVNRGNYSDALAQYSEAWALLPEPKFQWEAALWIIAAIGDAYFFMHDYERALQAFSDAVRCPNGVGNPFTHLRLGECYFELGNKPKAQDELTRAYMGGGRELFNKEDPKYLDLLRSVLQPPAGQTKL